jgi:hypothetical protein
MPSESARSAAFARGDSARVSSTESENCSNRLSRGVVWSTSTATKRWSAAPVPAGPTLSMSLRYSSSVSLPTMARRCQRVSARSAAERRSTADAAPGRNRTPVALMPAGGSKSHPSVPVRTATANRHWSTPSRCSSRARDGAGLSALPCTNMPPHAIGRSEERTPCTRPLQVSTHGVRPANLRLTHRCWSDLETLGKACDDRSLALLVHRSAVAVCRPACFV